MNVTRLTSTVHAVTSNSLWQGADGVYKCMFSECKIVSQTHSYLDDNDHSIGGHCIVRALASLYECNKTSSDLQAYIKEYINVQVSLCKSTVLVCLTLFFHVV